MANTASRSAPSSRRSLGAGAEAADPGQGRLQAARVGRWIESQLSSGAGLGRYEKLDLHVRLHAHQVGHPQQSGLDGLGVLHLVGCDYSIALQSEDIDQLNGSVYGIVELLGQLSSQTLNILEIDSFVGSVLVISGHFDILAWIQPELEQKSLNHD